LKTKIQKRAYGKLRDTIERRGGTMEYRREGYPHGAWEISLGKGRVILRAEGARTFPALDALYVPKIPHPKTWDDYHHKLIPGAEEQLLALLA